jgi:RNA 2',3'-cyclic 3'-phosphodiesterase
MHENVKELRCFVAIDLPTSVKSFLAQISAELKRCGGDVKWVRPEAMHLTVKFLGNVGSDRILDIQEALRLVFSGQSPMDMLVHGVGAFPGLGKPRVFWAGLKDLSGRLGPLALQVDSILEPLGFEREKRAFSPHLTLGRVRSNSGMRDLVDAVRQKMETQGPSFVAGGAVLYESVLKPSGAEYTPICRYPFSTGTSD